MQDFPWGILGIAPTKDRKAIRTAYSAKLKAMDVDADVQGYETLRAARGEALYLATQDDDAEPQTPQFSPLGTAAELAPITASETKQEPGTTIDAVEAEDLPPPSTAPDDLLAILFPNKEQTEEPLTAEEYEEALGHMREVITDARSAQIDAQTGIEQWLAHFLANAWPRSGPLIEEASEAFSWDKDAGRIDEDPAVAFLNGRLELIRRLEQIEDPGHRYNPAWEELKKPGKRSRFAFGGPSSQDIVALIQAIREETPELENYLDEERVQSWIDPQTSGLPGWAITMLILFALSGVVRMCNAASDGPPGSIESAEVVNWPAEDRQVIIDEVFGPGVTIVTLANEVPQAQQRLTLATITHQPTDEGKAIAEEALRNTMRRATLQAAGAANFDQLLQIKTLKRDLMRMARRDGGANACIWLMRTGALPDGFAVPEDFKAKETQLFRTLLDAGVFSAEPAPIATTATVPGNVVEEVLGETRMDRDDWDSVAGSEEATPERCNYEIAMLDIVLMAPGKVSIDLLRML